MARAEAQKYNAREDERFASETRGPESAPGGPSPTASGGPKGSDPTSEQLPGTGARPKTYRTARRSRDQSSSSEEEEHPSVTGSRGRGAGNRRRSLTPEMPSAEARTSSLGSTPDLGFNLEDLTTESSPEEMMEGPTCPGVKRSRRPSEPRTPGSASPMGKRSKDPSAGTTAPDPVKDPKSWLNYMRAEHPVIPHWWGELIEAKKGVSRENQKEQAKDLANQVFQTF